MAPQEPVGNPPAFELIALPSPTTVRDPDTQQTVDGYEVRVRSKETGATATLEIPKSRYTAAYVAQQAAAALAPLDETIRAFGASTLTGAPPASAG